MTRHPDRSAYPHTTPAMGRCAGVTLLELLVAMTVAAIILTVGVPSFQSFIQNNRATTHTNDLVTALQLARSEAVRRGRALTVCSSTDGETCGGDTDWTVGWVVRTDTGELVRSWPERSGGSNIITGPAASLEFQPRGSVSAGGTFQVRLPNCTGDQGRDVDVSFTGRVSVDRAGC